MKPDVLGLVSPSRDPLQWGGASYPSYEGRCEASPAGAASAGGGTPSPGSNAAPPTAPTTPGAPSAPGSAAASPAAGTIDWKSAPEQFRTEYEKLKTQHSAYEALGLKPEQIQSQVQTFQSYQQLALKIGETLGFDQADVEKHFAAKPLETLSYLRQKYNEAVQASRTNGGAPPENKLDPAIKEALEHEINPLKNFVAQQVTQAAVSSFNTEFDRLVNDTFKDDQKLDQDEIDFLYGLTSEMMKYDKPAMLRLRNEQKTSDVEKYFKEAADKYLKLQAKMEGRLTKRLGGPRPPGGGDPKPPAGFTLEDVIEGNDKASAALPSMRLGAR